MLVKRFACLLILLFCSACAIVRSPSISKIALLAPFEGRYREIGYNALYAVRMAIKDSDIKDISLLAVDDGGTEASAIARVQALNSDPDVEVIIALGTYSTSQAVQQATEKPFLIVGSWGTQAASDLSYILANPAIVEEIINPQIASITLADMSQAIVTAELFALAQVPDLYDDLSQLRIVSSASLPSAEFREAYITSDLYVPEPNLLASLTYDAAGLIIQSITSGQSISDISYEGINGTLEFEDGYWHSAPIYHYRYEGDKLSLIEDN